MAKLKAIDFRGANGVYHGARGERFQFEPLRHGCVSCWHLPWLERLRVLFTGRVWLKNELPMHPPCALHSTRPSGMQTTLHAGGIDVQRER